VSAGPNLHNKTTTIHNNCRFVVGVGINKATLAHAVTASDTCMVNSYELKVLERRV